MAQNPDLTQWLTARGLTQARLAELLPCNLRTLQNWVRSSDNREPPPFLWRALEHLDSELSISSNPSEGNKRKKEKRK
jgi:transcriptional regulator with XRE-family HTH domain